MFLATVIFSTKIGPSRESCVASNTLEGVHDKIERLKKVLLANRLLFIGSIVEEVQGVTPETDTLLSPLDFTTQNGKMFH